jgi:polyhydroxybutyrate depolymerase
LSNAERSASRVRWLETCRSQDLAFLATLIERIVAANHSDPTRVYLVGFSLGGFLALDFACARPGRIAAAVSVSGTRLQPMAACVQGSVSTLHVHGEQDSSVAPGGGVGRRTGVQYMSARGAAALAAAAAGCRRALTPAGMLSFGGQIERAADCRKGAKVELWMLAGVGHLPALDTHLARAILSFLKEVG